MGIEQLPDSGHHNDTANVALGAWGLLVAVLFLMLGSGLLIHDRCHPFYGYPELISDMFRCYRFICV